MGLVVNQPNHGGSNSNDGNTARKFFAEPTKSGSITSLDPTIIEKSANVLSVLSCGFSVNYISFKNYCIETASMWLEHFNWYEYICAQTINTRCRHKKGTTFTCGVVFRCAGNKRFMSFPC